MPDTVLSPRLSHLLIQEDRKTGLLIHPDRERDATGMPPPMSTQRTVSRGSGGSDSPRSHVASPSERTFNAPSHLRPSSRESHLKVPERKPSHSINNLLNELSVGSPPSDASGSISPLSNAIPPHRLYSPPPLPLQRPAPRHAHTAVSGPYPVVYRRPSPPHVEDHRRSVTGPMPSARPDMFRRHSAHPYEHAARQEPYPAYRPVPLEMTPVGSRAPISRTTKACNACRTRKVRCDAGGGGGATEPSTCSRCREAGVACVYSGVQKKRGPCPGTARPSISGQRRKSSYGNQPSPYPSVSPPERSAHPNRSSYGFPPPAFPTSHSYPPPHHRPSMPADWTSRPTYDPRIPPVPHHHDRNRAEPPSRKPSIFSWPVHEPAMEVDERDRAREREHHEREREKEIESERGQRKMFANEYTMRPMTSSESLEDEERGGMGSFFGDKGRSLPPLRMAIQRGSSYYEP